jgi:putative Holliday junction resolvase
MGLDFGMARIGVSVCDELEIAAHPAPTVTNDDQVFERLRGIAAERDVEMIVVGLPLNMDGSEGGSARKVRSFVKQLKRELPGLPVEFYDERLSTHEAHEALSQMGADPQTRREEVDRVAAQLILQRFLEARREGR